MTPTCRAVTSPNEGTALNAVDGLVPRKRSWNSAGANEPSCVTDSSPTQSSGRLPPQRSPTSASLRTLATSRPPPLGLPQHQRDHQWATATKPASMNSVPTARARGEQALPKPESRPPQWSPDPGTLRESTCTDRRGGGAHTLTRVAQFHDRMPNRTTLTNSLVTSGISSL